MYFLIPISYLSAAAVPLSRDLSFIGLIKPHRRQNCYSIKNDSKSNNILSFERCQHFARETKKFTESRALQVITSRVENRSLSRDCSPFNEYSEVNTLSEFFRVRRCVLQGGVVREEVGRQTMPESFVRGRREMTSREITSRCGAEFMRRR